MDKYEHFGGKVRDFLLGLTDNISNNSSQPNYNDSEHQYEGNYGPLSLLGNDAELTVSNPGAVLKPGNLLITNQNDKSCYQVDHETGEIEFLFAIGRRQDLFIWRAYADSVGNIICSYSGIIINEDPVRHAKFGSTGGVIELNYRIIEPNYPYSAKFNHLHRGAKMVDPLGLHSIDDDLILVSDFNGFGDTGSIYIINRKTASVLLTHTGGRLIDPIKAIIDVKQNIYVANAIQSSQDGEILMIDRYGNQSIVMPKQGDNTGALIDLLQSPNQDDLVVITDNLPKLDKSSIFLFNKLTGEKQILLSASEGASKFYSQADIVDNYMWVAESYDKKLLKIDLTTKKVVKQLSLSPLLGDIKGIRSSYNVIESVSVIPNHLN